MVSSDGRAAWITVYRPDPPQSQLWMRSFAGVSALDSGLIDPVSLELVEVALETGLGVAVNYTKDGGTVGGNSSLD